jgi:hypothetical protein
VTAEVIGVGEAASKLRTIAGCNDRPFVADRIDKAFRACHILDDVVGILKIILW